MRYSRSIKNNIYNLFLKKINKHILSLGFLGLILSSLVLNVLEPGELAFADPNPALTQTIASDFTPTQEATSYSYYVALGGCVENVMQGTIYPTPSEGSNSPTSEWFNTSDPFWVDYAYVYPNATKTNCDDIASEALSLWGWTGSTESFLEAMGYTYSANDATGQPTYTDTSTSQVRLKDFQQAVQTEVYGGVAPTLSGAANYVIDLNALTQDGGTCNSKDLGLYTNLNSTEKQYVDKGTTVKSGQGRTITETTYTELPIVDTTTGAQINHGYTYSITSTASLNGSDAGYAFLYGYPTGSAGIPVQLSCAQLVAGIKKNADAYSAEIKQNGADTPTTVVCQNQSTAAGCAGSTSCAIPGVGWIVCPMVTFLANITGSVYGVIASLLSTSTAVVSNTSGTHAGWVIMRNLANAGFIIVFLVIIFSQITSFGVSNYGIKKLLPKLVIAAILVNASYIICQLAIDISNILGGSLETLLANNVPIFSTNAGPASTANIAGTAADVLAGTVGVGLVGAAAVGATLYFGVGIFVPIIIAGLVAVLMTLFILLARQALVILLVVLAPLAFLAMLLPNTEGWFKKWRQAFVAILFIYPAVALLFGGSQLASEILVSTYGQTSAIGTFLGLAFAVLPLFFVPALLKGSLNAIPMAGNLASKLHGQAVGASRKGTAKGVDLANQKASATDNRFSRFTSKAFNGIGRNGRRRAAAAKRAYEEPRIKDVTEQWANQGAANNEEGKLEAIIANPSTKAFERSAAIAQLARIGDTGALTRIHEKIQADGDKKGKIEYDKAVAPYFSALKAKDLRSVFANEELGKPGGKYDSATPADMHSMKDDALDAASFANETFRKNLIEAVNDPLQANNFSAAVRSHFANEVSAKTYHTEVSAKVGKPIRYAASTAAPATPTPAPSAPVGDKYDQANARAAADRANREAQEAARQNSTKP